MSNEFKIPYPNTKIKFSGKRTNIVTITDSLGQTAVDIVQGDTIIVSCLINDKEYKFDNIKFDQVEESQNTYQPKDKLDEYIIKGATYSTKFVPLMNDGSDGSDYTNMMSKDAKRLFCLLYTSPSPRDQ